ncbi:MAG: hypothetical protein B6244_04600 [Candidatus Cloacimonetes bacterium 4572_55]|nr:MAG: hypothetical protein B6244_04600 [Candidatus Cloacimonetes bacterium 4572_55]
MNRFFGIVAILISCLLISACADSGELEDYLADLILSADRDDMIPVYVRMTDRVDLEQLKNSLRANHATLAEQHFATVTALRQKSETTQSDLLSYLGLEEQLGDVASYQSMWIGNYVILTAKPEIISRVAAREDVEKVYYDAPLSLIRPIRSTDSEPPESRSVESGLREINAHLLWQEGITGQGRLVSNFDTGVDGSHPALSQKWRGNNGAPPAFCWFDPANGTSSPQDFGQHGTHTMGTILGSSAATGDTVGVAFGAQWIAVAGVDYGDIISDGIQAFQWIADPDGNPETMNDVPDVINNSWGLPPSGSYPDCYDGFNDVIDGAEAAGVVVIFAAGNEGPSPSTLRSPGNRIASDVSVFSVGALQPGSVQIAGFSSRGPTQCSLSPGQPDSLRIKPEIAARGDDVRSTVPGGGYEGGWSGTSMAAPHVAGAVALLRQISPNASPEEIKRALIESAVDLGTTGNDNTYGYGRIDVYAASQLLGGHVEGYATLEGSEDHGGVKIWSTLEESRPAISETDGYYKLTGLGEGTHSLTARHIGYYDSSIENIPVILGETTTDVNVSLQLIGYTPGNVHAVSELNLMTLLTWESPTEEPAYYKVYRGTDPGGAYELIADHVADTELEDQDVLNGHAYFYVVTAVYENPYGETFFSEEAMAIPGERVDLPVISGFELDDTGGLYPFIIDGGSGGALWERGEIDPEHGPGQAEAGTKVWATGLSENYAHSADVYLLTPLIDMTEETGQVKLSFDHWYEFEGSGSRGFDGGNIAISTNAGDTWIVLHPEVDYDDMGVPGLDQEAGFSGSSGDWVFSEFDLTDYIGWVVMIRIRFGSDAGVSKAGWFVDNLYIGQPNAIEDEQETAISRYSLAQNSPNPFNPTTAISFQIPKKEPVELTVYNTVGQQVKTLVDKTMDSGAHVVRWNGTNDSGLPVSSGVYFYRLKTASFDYARRMVLLK